MNRDNLVVSVPKHTMAGRGWGIYTVHSFFWGEIYSTVQSRPRRNTQRLTQVDHGTEPGSMGDRRRAKATQRGRAQRFRQGARSRCRRGARSRRWGPARPTLTQMGLPSHPPLQHLHACTVSAVPQLCFFGQDTRRRAHPHQSLSLSL